MTSSPGPVGRPLGHAALAPFGTTIFATMSALAAEHDAINLGQGFPDTDGPPEVLEAAVAAIRGGRNQYPPGAGVPELLDAIAVHQKRFYGLEVDPASEVLVTVGATEAIAATVLALVQPGDEVVTFEPYYDSYAATIALAGGVRRTSVLRFPDFAVDEASLRAAFSSRTRLVLLNTPHNPTGKVFTRAELELVCALAREHDAWVVTDEVYEHLRVRRCGARAGGDAAGDAVADPDDLVGRKDVLDHRVEGRLGLGARRGGGGGAGGEAVPHLRRRRGRSSRRWPPGSGCRMPCTPGLASSLSAKRDRLVEGLRRAGMSVSVPRGHVLRDRGCRAARCG